VTSAAIPMRHGATSVRRTERMPAASRGKETVFALFGILGLVSVAWLVIAASMSLSVVVFKTGSMAPTMPTGSAAIVQTVDASRLVVGDVVTVQRSASELPVTHRIVSIAADPASPQRVQLTLQGDANQIADGAPYSVSRAGLVVASLPFVGYVVAALRTPVALGAISLVIAGLIVWAFWPASLAAHRAQKRRARS
jgi:signal peptidase I